MSFSDEIAQRVRSRVAEGAAYAPGKLTPLDCTEIDAVSGGMNFYKTWVSIPGCPPFDRVTHNQVLAPQVNLD